MLIYKKAGVTMLEVLITLVLVAIISSIAVPSYRTFTRSAKTAEAKSSLSQIYMAEKSFFLNWRFYTAHLTLVGVFPDGELLYNAGFSAGAHFDPSSVPGVPQSLKNKINNEWAVNNIFWNICGVAFGSGSVKGCAFTKNRQNNQPPNLFGDLLAEQNKFRVMAIADLINETQEDLGNATNKDIWCINQYKQISRVNDGTKKTNKPVTAQTLNSACPL